MECGGADDITLKLRYAPAIQLQQRRLDLLFTRGKAALTRSPWSFGDCATTSYDTLRDIQVLL